MIVANTVTGSGHSGIVIGGSGGVDNITVRNNVFAFNARYGVQHDSTCPSSTLVDHNVLYGNPSGSVQSGCSAINTSGGNTIADPLFADHAARNFHLRAGSPAIGRGQPAWSPSHDYDGESRPQDAAPDAGAYEDG
jgi:hypothetical protein